MSAHGDDTTKDTLSPPAASPSANDRNSEDGELVVGERNGDEEDTREMNDGGEVSGEVSDSELITSESEAIQNNQETFPSSSKQELYESSPPEHAPMDSITKKDSFFENEPLEESQMLPPVFPDYHSSARRNSDDMHLRGRARLSRADAVDFLQDEPHHMTWARRIALYLMKYKWYYPAGKENVQEGSQYLKGVHDEDDLLVSQSVGDVEPLFPFSERETKKPSLERAWAYFEHFTLPRYVVESEQKRGLTERIFKCLRGTDLKLAKRGTTRYPTKLYPAFLTPLSQLGDFGIGIGLYFSTLRAIVLLTFLAGIVSLPNMFYYVGGEYSNHQEGLHALRRGSAICTDNRWVLCPTCQYEDFNQDELTRERFANVTVPDGSGSDINLIFALRNFCEIDTNSLGMVDYAILLLLIIGIFILHFYQEKKEVIFDEMNQTAQDYSIVITNPPHDAIDCDEWKNFFETNFSDVHVTVCTVSVDNDMLVRTLVERREVMKQIEMMLPPDESLDTLNLAKISAKIEKKRRLLARILAKLFPGIPELFARVVVLTATVQGLAQWSRPAKNIFITFETESAQRRVLSHLSVGLIDAMRNNTSKISNPNHLFRGEKVLYAREADEPSTVRWKDLNQRKKDIYLVLVQTTIVSIGAIVLIAYIVSLCKDQSSLYAAIAISLFNSAFPEFAKFLTGYESHASEGSKQVSLYLKISAFRWVNTAIVITIITPFMATLAPDNQALISTVYTIFFTEIITTNVLQITDVWGHIQRHVLAPRSKTQERMNRNMRGTPYELAERYTNVTKIFFLAVYYGTIFPAAFFMASFALTVNFITDRFSLLRSWEKTPQLGTRLTKFSRKYFFTIIILAMAISSSYFWSGFPYDNLCEVDDGGDFSKNYIGTWTATTAGGKSIQATVESEDISYKFCLQDLLRVDGKIAFPALPKHQPKGNEWMTPDQENIVELYGWTSLGILITVVVLFLWDIMLMVWNLYSYKYKPRGKDQNINYSDVESIAAFVPQVDSDFFPYPLLCCNIGEVDTELLDWTDPDRPHSFYDLTIDAEKVLRGNDLFTGCSTNVFSKIKHWWPQDREETVAANSEMF